MKRYTASRWKQLIFPQELLIDKYHALSRKRHFPAFWIVTEESIPLSKLASIQIQRGFLFSKLIIENSGGPFPIIVDGLWNRPAREARDLLEMIEREMQGHDDIGPLVGDSLEEPGNHPRPGSNGGTPGGPSRGPGGDHREHDKESRQEAVVAADITPQRHREVIYREPSMKAATACAPQLDFESIPSRPATPAIEAILEMKNPGRKFGEIPGDEWTPPPPWKPQELPRQELECELTRQPEILCYGDTEPSSDLGFQATAIEEPEVGDRISPVEQLTNWWENTRASFKVPDTGLLKRRRRKLN